MDFTIYTFGDVEIFRAALMGLAMIYNPADGFFVSNTGVGLGALAGLGLLIGLTVLLLQGVTKQKLDIGEFLMLIIVFVVLFVPKFSVNIEDYNGSAIAKVDDVPLGVALPAGLVSGLAHELNNKLGTAYSTINGYPTGLMTPQALTSPLKLLHSLRDAAPQARFYEPRLYANLRNLIAYCAAGREGVQQEWERLRVGDDPVLKLVTFAGTQHGLTMFIPAGGTEPYLDTCSKAANDIASGIAAFSSNGSPASTISNVLTAAAARSNAATIIFDGTRPRVEPVTVDKQEEALAMLAQSEAGDAANFLRSAIFNPDINATLHCAGKSANPADWKNCMPFQEGVLRYAEDSAAAGSFFQRLMYHGMNLVFFLWICLAPVVSVVMLMMGVRGLRLAGSYLLFGAWAVSWYVGASIINFYVLKQVQYEVAMLGGIKNLTPESINSFIGYGGVLGTKIAMAGDMLASVPLLMMAVMSGSVYGLTQLASRMGGRDYYDEARNVPAAASSAPLFERSARHAMPYDGMTEDRLLGTGGNFTFTLGASLANTNSIQSQKILSSTLMNGLTNALSQSVEHGKAGEEMKALGTKLASQGYAGLSLAEKNGRTYTLEKSGNWKIDQSNYHDESGGRSTTAGGSLGYSPGKLASGARAGYQADDSRRAGEKRTVTETEANSGKGGKAYAVETGDETGVRFSRDLTSDDMVKIGKTFKEAAGHQYQRAFGDNQQSVESYVDSGGVTYSSSTSQGGTISLTPTQMAMRIREMGLQKAIESYTDQRFGWSSDARQAYERAERMARAEYAGISDSADKENLIKANALRAAAMNSSDKQAKQSWENFAGQVTGADISGIAPVSLMTGGSNQIKAQGWEGSANRGALAQNPNENEAGKKGSTVGQRAANGAATVVLDAGEGREKLEEDQSERLKAAQQLQRALNRDPGGMDVKARPVRPKDK